VHRIVKDLLFCGDEAGRGGEFVSGAWIAGIARVRSARHLDANSVSASEAVCGGPERDLSLVDSFDVGCAFVWRDAQQSIADIARNSARVHVTQPDKEICVAQTRTYKEFCPKLSDYFDIAS
jgi:hypothetical protein